MQGRIFKVINNIWKFSGFDIFLSAYVGGIAFKRVISFLMDWELFSRWVIIFLWGGGGGGA